MKRYGVAIDIGTTTLTVGLIELPSGKEAGIFVGPNPQIKFGDDVVSRIDYSIRHKAGLAELHDAITSGIDTAVAKLTKEAVEKFVIVGNTAMEHFYLKIPAQKLVEAPYRSSLAKGIIKTKNACLLPIIKSFVGSDLTAGILYMDLLAKPGVNILIDIGTNGEMALVAANKFLVTSTAAGPAFETSDKGMHGSEIIEAVSVMLKSGAIEKNGKLNPAPLKYSSRTLSKVRDSDSKKNEQWCGVKITQHDIRRVQYAKAAIMAGMHAMVKKAGFDFADITNLYVGGKFGNFINKEAAVRIGLLPDIGLNRIKAVGNTAYKGAVLALCSEKELKKTLDFSKKATHLSLFARKEFQEEFIRGMNFQ